MKPEHRSALLALAARRGEKGFSNLLAEAIDEFLQGEAERRQRREDVWPWPARSARGCGGGPANDPGVAGELAVIAADTDVLIDFLSGVEPVAAQIGAYVATDELQTTAVTCFELLSGAGEGKRSAAIRQLSLP